LSPAKALWRAISDGAVNFLKIPPILRFIVGLIGLVMLLLGAISSVLWNVPLLSWLSGSDVAPPFLAAGGFALGIWYLSRKGSNLPR
jgi:hypothetical protein